MTRTVNVTVTYNERGGWPTAKDFQVQYKFDLGEWGVPYTQWVDRQLKSSDVHRCILRDAHMYKYVIHDYSSFAR